VFYYPVAALAIHNGKVYVGASQLLDVFELEIGTKANEIAGFNFTH
jgi:hypothetical protein